MFDIVELIVHHGGSFVRDPATTYIGGEVDRLRIDPDYISYTHPLKSLKEGKYGNIHGLYYKTSGESMEQLLELFNDESTLKPIVVARSCGSCEIYVHHGLDEVKLVDILPLPSPNVVVEEQIHGEVLQQDEALQADGQGEKEADENMDAEGGSEDQNDRCVEVCSEQEDMDTEGHAAMGESDTHGDAENSQAQSEHDS
ncbi:unnamed protein product, partial [Cuscuta europaea]